MYLDLFLKLFNLLPVIVAGIQAVHTDKTLGQKQAIAQDILTTAVQGVQAVAPSSAALAGQIGTIVSKTLSDTIATLHAPASAAGAQPTQG